MPSGTVTPAGGGGFRPARNVGQAEYDYNGVGDIGTPTTPRALTYSAGATGLLNLTAPAAPLIVTAGVYSVIVTCSTGGSDVLQPRLLLDDNFYSIPAYAPYTVNAFRSSVSATWFCDAGDPLAV